MRHLRNPRCGWNYTACAGAERLWRLYYRLFCKYTSCAAPPRKKFNLRRRLFHCRAAPVWADCADSPPLCIIKVRFQNPVIRKSSDGHFCSAALCHTSCPPLVDLCEADRPPMGGFGLRLIIIIFILDRLIVWGLYHVKINLRGGERGGGDCFRPKEKRIVSFPSSLMTHYLPWQLTEMSQILIIVKAVKKCDYILISKLALMSHLKSNQRFISSLINLMCN